MLISVAFFYKSWMHIWWQIFVPLLIFVFGCQNCFFTAFYYFIIINFCFCGNLKYSKLNNWFFFLLSNSIYSFQTIFRKLIFVIGAVHLWRASKTWIFRTPPLVTKSLKKSCLKLSHSLRPYSPPKNRTSLMNNPLCIM